MEEKLNFLIHLPLNSVELKPGYLLIATETLTFRIRARLSYSS